MKKIISLLSVLVGLILLFCLPESARAGSSIPDPPPPASSMRITPPDISGVNPDVTLSEGHEGEITPSGMVSAVGFLVPVPAGVEAPPYQDLEPAPQESLARLDWTYNLAVPFREQVQENGCGAAALGMALEALARTRGEQAPTIEVLLRDLDQRGLWYKSGTGVEELAALARSAGYPGSRAFQDWTLEQLAGELAAGHPVLVSLDLNGSGQPGHFVTLNGITGDGQTVRYLDPARGEVITSREEFLKQWEGQGASGLTLSGDPLPPGEDPLAPWLGLFGALSMLMVLAQNTAVGEEPREIVERVQGWLSRSDRPGLGGSLTPGSGSGGGGTVRVPRYETRLVRKGWKTVEKQVPVFENRRMQVGTREVKKQVPVYTDRKVQVGTRTVTRQVPRYVTKRIRVGTRTVKKKVKVTRYKKKVRYSWKRVTKKVPVYRKYGWYRVRVGTKNVTRWKRVRQVRKVPYTSWKTVTKKVPVYKDIRVRQGNRTVSEQVPVYAWKKVRTGTRTVTVSEPVYEDKKVRVGLKTVSGQVPNFERERVQVGWQEVPVLEGGGDEGEIAAAVLKERGGAVSGSGGEGEIAAAVLKEREDAVSGSGGEGEMSILDEKIRIKHNLFDLQDLKTTNLQKTGEDVYNVKIFQTPKTDQEIFIESCEEKRGGVYIGDNPYKIDDSQGNEDPMPGVPGILLGLVALFNTIAGPYAYKKHLLTQDPNVIAQVYVEKTNGKSKIKLVRIDNQSGQNLKVFLNTIRSGKTIEEFGPLWIEVGNNLFYDSEILSNSKEKFYTISIPKEKMDSVLVTIYAKQNDPLLIRCINIPIK